MHLKHCAAVLALAVVTSIGVVPADAYVVTVANAKASAIASKAPGTPPAVRIMAHVQVAMFEAVNGITGRYPPLMRKINAAPGASVDAAVASATRTVLLKLMPTQQQAIDADYEAALKLVADGPAKRDGIAVGEQAATACLARPDEGLLVPDTYRPHAAPGVYVPTMPPAVPNWGKRKPWVMSSGSQFRPGPPPALTSQTWVRDYNEIKALGGKYSTRRTPEQTEIARFWEATMPPIYHVIVRSVANMPGREVTRNARVFMAVTQATDDALIAVLGAKYHDNFWRPVTAIRNGDSDGNDATEREPSWTPFIDTPMHPEYPCAHCIVSATVGLNEAKPFFEHDLFDFARWHHTHPHNYSSLRGR